MRQRISTLFLVFLMFIAIGGVQKALAAEADIRPTSLEIIDADGNTPNAPDTPIFEVHAGGPVLAPDGHQLTLAEFTTVSGIVTAECVDEGTRVTLHMTGLIPNGVYSAWSDIYTAPQNFFVGRVSKPDDLFASRLES